MDKQAQAELRTATLLLSGLDGRLQHIEQGLGNFHQAAVLIGGFDGRLCQIERHLRTMAEGSEERGATMAARLAGLEAKVLEEADDSWNLESAFESLRTNLSRRVSCLEKQLAELAEGSKVRHGQLEFMLNTLRRQLARLSPAFNPPIPSITEACEQAAAPPPEPPRHQEPGIPGILEMLEHGIRTAWAAQDWDLVIRLSAEYRQTRNTL